MASINDEDVIPTQIPVLFLTSVTCTYVMYYIRILYGAEILQSNL